ncbi:MAG: AarF/ABC1/UbiB kinase family protein [bacterium]|nr:AarF/ABC1/UbiB kinase family protein [bacterium]
MILTTWRATVVLWFGVYHLLMHRLGLWFGGSSPSGPKRLRLFLERIGGSYLKFGQVLSLQPDIVPQNYCEALFDLLDKVPPFPYSEVEKIFQEDHGKRPDEIFDIFDKTPLASASIAQVHRAVLNGRELAVKVRRPNVVRIFGQDIAVLRSVASGVGFLRIKSLRWLGRAVDEFSAWTHEELDFRYEARFMRALLENATDNPTETVPSVIAELSNDRVLVADFLDGPTVLDYIRNLDNPNTELEARLAEIDFDAEVFAENIVDNFVWDAFQHGLFHADLHPANLIILPDNVVGYVDFGITGSLSTYSRRHIVAMTLALTQAEPDELIDHFLRIAVADSDADPALFRRRLRKQMDDWTTWKGDTPTFTMSYSLFMLDFLTLNRQTGVGAMPDALRYLRSVITADGLVARFAPDVNVAADLERLCRRYLEQDMWRRWASMENLGDWTSAAVHLVDAVPRVLENLVDSGDDSGVPDPSPKPVHEPVVRRHQRKAAWYGLLAITSIITAFADSTPFVGMLDLARTATMTAGIGAIMFMVNFFRGFRRQVLRHGPA